MGGESSIIQLPLVLTTGGVTVLLASALAFVLLKVRGTDKESQTELDAKPEKKQPEINEAEFPGGSISVYYATQTGTSESFAKELEREGREHGFHVNIVDLEDVQVDELVDESHKDSKCGTARAIFLAATYGEGEPTDNATAFVQAMKEKAGIDEGPPSEVDSPTTETCLVGLDYCVFGLGNKQYDHYNAMGKFFDQMLARLGGNRLAAIGLGDDDSDLEGDFENWRDNVLWPTLKKKYLSEADSSREFRLSVTGPQGLPDCQYAVEYHDVGDCSKPEKLPLEQIHGPSRNYFTAVDCPVKVVRELRSSEDLGSTVHVEVDISQAKDLSYETADNLGVLPVNDSSVVEFVAEKLGYDLDACFSLKAAATHEWHGAPFPMPLSVRECLTRYCDLTSAPLRSDLKQLASYARDPTDQKALQRMSSKEGKAEYREKILGDHVGLADLLKRCPSIAMPLEHFLNVCPLLQTRFYTISSSAALHPDTVHLTVAVTKYDKKEGSRFYGVCSTYIAECKPGTSNLRVLVRPSTFRLPKDTTRPILMIGPGTGIAPMRAFLQERSFQRNNLGKKVGPNILYFGCKKTSQDFIYEEELKAYQKSGDLNQLHLAFSRQQKEKVYVQHLLQKNAKDTWKLISDDGAYIFVCGGVKMGKDVSDALKEIFASQGNISADAAKEYLAKLTEGGRFVQELWS